MAGAKFNVGRDYQVVVTHPLWTGANNRLDLQIVTDVDVKPNPKMVTVAALSGVDYEVMIPGKYTGTITIERGNSVVDDFQAIIDAAYYANAGTLPYGSIVIYINEIGGNQTAYLYTDCTIHVTDLGSAKSDATIKQTLSFTASKRRKIS
jgi:hypothetical protein